MDLSTNTYIKVEDDDDLFQHFEDREPLHYGPSDNDPRSGPIDEQELLDDYKRDVGGVVGAGPGPESGGPGGPAQGNDGRYTMSNTSTSNTINANGNTQGASPDMRSYVTTGDMYPGGGCPIKIPEERRNTQGYLLQSPQGNRGRPASHVDRFIHDNINSAGSFSSLGSSLDTYYSSGADDLGAVSETSPQPAANVMGLMSPGLNASTNHRPFSPLSYAYGGQGGASTSTGPSGSHGLGHSKTLSMPNALSASPRKHAFTSGGISKNRNSVSGPSTNLSSGNLSGGGSGNVSTSGSAAGGSTAASPRAPGAQMGPISALATSAPSDMPKFTTAKIVGLPTNTGAASLEEKQQMLLERRRRRRESHNAVERRRRDNINEKIKELSELVPEQFLLAAMEAGMKSGTADDRPNKGTILARSVDYIRLLQEIIDRQNHVEVEFQDLVNRYQMKLGEEPTSYNYTSAEVALREAGLLGGPPPPQQPPSDMSHQQQHAPTEFRQPDFGYEAHHRTSSLSHALMRTKLDQGPNMNDNSNMNINNNNNIDQGDPLSPGYQAPRQPQQQQQQQQQVMDNGNNMLSPQFDLDYVNHTTYLKHNEHAIDDDYGY